MKPDFQLPPVTEVERAHSQQLIRRLSDEIIRSGGCLSFARYMEQVLYAPGLGYYCAGKRKFGAAGDFVTAPEISPLFSRCLASQCQQVLATTGGSILEFGAGSGVMAAEILQVLQQHDSLPDEYLILDISADLRARQQHTLQLRVPQLQERVRWLDELPDSFHGVILANEVLDAMPVHRVDFSNDPPLELCVECHEASGKGDFCWNTKDIHDERLMRQARRIRSAVKQLSRQVGYISEINLAASDWVRSLAMIVEQGVVMIIDYGFPREEYYHPDRRDGTLMCHYRHRAHDNPLILPGLQDITAHIDFTAIAEAAVENGLSVAGYTTQAHFLLSTGLTDLLEEAMTEEVSQRITLTQQVKKLTLPHEMGELFKVMALTKRFEEPLIGFTLSDQRMKL